MRFERVDTCMELELLCCKSTEGKFILGFRRMIEGFRVSLMNFDPIPQRRMYIIDYCMGTEFVAGALLLHELRCGLMLLDESEVTEQKLRKLGFRHQPRKPMSSDPDFFQEIRRVCLLMVRDCVMQAPENSPPILPKALTQDELISISSNFVKLHEQFWDDLASSGADIQIIQL